MLLFHDMFWHLFPGGCCWLTMCADTIVGMCGAVVIVCILCDDIHRCASIGIVEVFLSCY